MKRPRRCYQRFLCAGCVFLLSLGFLPAQEQQSTGANAEDVINAITENCEKFTWVSVLTIERTEDMAVPYIKMHRLPYDRGGTGFGGTPLKAELIYLKTVIDGVRWLITIDFYDSPRIEKGAQKTRDAKRGLMSMLSSIFPAQFSKDSGAEVHGE
ncbi:MAG: hypothetical protein LBD22_06250 [Spirochaetaceae bacterium]|jgi:hypothetical protein|nr:hypothetical protein [Spirochaetaceae bacterium]